jgi:hypothetical protein
MSLLRAAAFEAPFRSFLRAALRFGLGSWHQAALFDALPYNFYAVGLEAAVRSAQMFQQGSFTAIEFGVAGGNGLMSLISHARSLRRLTGLDVQVVGFDAGAGLPECSDWRDAPWLFNPGDYPCDIDALRKRIDGGAELIIGDIRETLPLWLSQPHPPIGFASIDVDYYSSSKPILENFRTCPGDRLLPISALYFDDVDLFGMPSRAGELAAISEFNSEATDRFIDRADWLRCSRPFPEAPWLRKMFDLYCLDERRMQHEPRSVRRHDLVPVGR